MVGLNKKNRRSLFFQSTRKNKHVLFRNINGDVNKYCIQTIRKCTCCIMILRDSATSHGNIPGMVFSHVPSLSCWRNRFAGICHTICLLQVLNYRQSSRLFYTSIKWNKDLHSSRIGFTGCFTLCLNGLSVILD